MCFLDEHSTKYIFCEHSLTSNIAKRDSLHNQSLFVVNFHMLVPNKWLKLLRHVTCDS